MNSGTMAAGVPQSVRANDEQFAQFTRGLAAVLNQWTALQLVVQHCDPNALNYLYQTLVQWFQQSGEVFSDELEDYLEEFFEASRSVAIEDESIKEVSDVLHGLYFRCCQNDFSPVQHYVESEAVYKQVNPLSQCINGTASEDTADFQLGGDEALLQPYAGEEEEADMGENEEDDTGDDGPQAVMAEEKPKKRPKRKNASKKSADGWNVVL